MCFKLPDEFDAGIKLDEVRSLKIVRKPEKFSPVKVHLDLQSMAARSLQFMAARKSWSSRESSSSRQLLLKHASAPLHSETGGLEHRMQRIC